MSNPYTIDLTLEVAYKLGSNGTYAVSSLSAQWASLVGMKFWMCKFIRDFGSSLPNGANYEVEYLAMESLDLLDYGIYIVIKEYISLVSLLISNKWNIKSELLMVASKTGKLAIVKLLVLNGADIHFRTDSSLLFASKFGHLEVIEFLLDNGADINAYNGEPLRVSAEYGHLDVVKLLLSKGADYQWANPAIL